ncbi:MAG: phosphotransferase [Planctomycetes bacterium]|nr:phosphotransferase [Planctomycetota bacterium]
MDLERFARLLGSQVVAARKIARGYTPAERWVVSLADGRSAFCKVGANQNTADWLHKERAVYEGLRAQGASFLPELLGFDPDPSRPILALEDLSGASWPPPWTPERVEAVRATLDQVHALRLPVPAIGFMGEAFEGWSQVGADPGPFLGLGLAGEGWLEGALPTLLAAQEEVSLAGEALLHLDVRSDNLCLRDGRALLIDWNHACLGNPEVDLGFWLPSLAAEGGPLPDAVLPDRGPLAALISGFFAARAGLPVIPHAPRVREIQQVQLAVALPWAARALGLPPLGDLAR